VRFGGIGGVAVAFLSSPTRSFLFGGLVDPDFKTNTELFSAAFCLLGFWLLGLMGGKTHPPGSSLLLLGHPEGETQSSKHYSDRW
jgi:hypothetical protein